MKRTNIFLSYCWNDSNEANKIYDYFKSSQDIELHRDTIDIGKWGSIKEYMQSISNMDYTILLISDSYLKSANCMYEVLEVMRDRNYRDKIFPAVICSGIYNPVKKAEYVKYWQDEFGELESKLKEISLQNLGKLNGDLKRRQDISSNIAEFLDVVSDMNNPKVEDVCVIIEKKLNQKGFIGNHQIKSENGLFATLGRPKAKRNSERTGLANNQFARNGFNQIYYEDDAYKKSTGIKKGLRLCGNEDEIKVAEQLSKFFKITFSRAGMFKTTSYVFNFLQPGEEFRDYYNLYNEVLLLFSPYTEFESRTLDFVDKTLEEFDNRLDKVCVFLISKDPNIESKINGINTSNKDSRIIVPFTYKEVLHNGISKDDISGKLRKYFYNRDLFALESPLKTEAYFYGRNTLIQKLYDKYLMGEQSGLFGLRKTGKTSVLYALERQMILRSGYSIYIDCQNPGIYILRWNELLKYIIDEIIKKYELDLIIEEDLYIEKKAAGSFEKNLKKINNKIGTRVLLMFDEIEHICFKTSDKEHWKSGEDYCMFWQTIRSVFQKEPECFTFLIAGVNPLCIETDYVNGIENPIFL